jgi:hypothetical protein
MKGDFKGELGSRQYGFIIGAKFVCNFCAIYFNLLLCCDLEFRLNPYKVIFLPKINLQATICETLANFYLKSSCDKMLPFVE